MTYESQCAGLVHLALTTMVEIPDASDAPTVDGIVALLRDGGERVRGELVDAGDVRCGLRVLRERGEAIALFHGGTFTSYRLRSASHG